MGGVAARRESVDRGVASRAGSLLGDAIAVGAALTFAVLWLGLAYALVADAGLPDRAWAWLRGLEPAIQVVAWVALLPIAVGLWTWTSSWPAFVDWLVAIVLVGWTVAAVAGLRRVGRAGVRR